MTTEKPRLKRGQSVELEIETAGFEGLAVARHEGFVVFVRNAVPGDRARVQIQRTKRRFAEGIVEEILRPSPDRMTPRCPHFGTCGGCNWQNLDYRRQLQTKRQHVIDLMDRIGRLRDYWVRPTAGSPRQLHYRNKMEFSFGARRWLTREEIESGEEFQRDFALGLHVPKRFDRILNLEVCYLPETAVSDILTWVRGFALQRQWSAYDVRKHEGFLRNLVIRTSQATGQVLVNLVTSRRDTEAASMFTEALLAEFPQVTTVLNSVNSTRSPVAAGEVFVEHGPGRIEEVLAGLRFYVGPNTFFQPNTFQAERLFEIVQEFAVLRGGETVFDLYCGIGAISLFLSRNAGRVIGLEVQPEAVQAAEENARLNGIENCSFRVGDVFRALEAEWQEEFGTPEVMVLDPPRPGLHPELCRGLAERGPKRIVYVSCNPATQARDLQILTQSYHVQAVQPVDMFPHTYHIENVVALVKE